MQMCGATEVKNDVGVSIRDFSYAVSIDNGRCNGVLISPDWVLANTHHTCVDENFLVPISLLLGIT